MQLKNIVRSLAVAGLMGMTACSASAEVSSKQAAAIKEKITKNIPGRAVVSVQNSPMKGMFEVVLQGNLIVYTDAKADYMIFGDMVDVVKKKSVTEERLAELRKIDPSTLPLDMAIKEVRGNGSRQLVVFSDPDCPFCKRLEQDGLNGVTDITIYTFLMPLAQLHPDAARKSRLIWCAEDRTAAWKNWILNGKLPENGKDDCENPVEKTIELGGKLGISGTPGLIFANGRMVPGAVPKAEIEKYLAEAASAPAAVKSAKK